MDSEPNLILLIEKILDYIEKNYIPPPPKLRHEIEMQNFNPEVINETLTTDDWVIVTKSKKKV